MAWRDLCHPYVFGGSLCLVGASVASRGLRSQEPGLQSEDMYMDRNVIHYLCQVFRFRIQTPPGLVMICNRLAVTEGSVSLRVGWSMLEPLVMDVPFDVLRQCATADPSLRRHDAWSLLCAKGKRD